MCKLKTHSRREQERVGGDREHLEGTSLLPVGKRPGQGHLKSRLAGTQSLLLKHTAQSTALNHKDTAGAGASQRQSQERGEVRLHRPSVRAALQSFFSQGLQHNLGFDNLGVNL